MEKLMMEKWGQMDKLIIEKWGQMDKLIMEKLTDGQINNGKIDKWTN